MLPFSIFVVRYILKNNLKLYSSFVGKLNSEKNIISFFKKNKSTNIIHFHVASSGELLQTTPLIQMFFKKRYKIFLTYSSISVKKWINDYNLFDKKMLYYSDFLPIDKKKNIVFILKLVRPLAIIYTQYDLWPGLIWEASKLKIPQFLISA